jgi:hypothetical protein
MSATIGRPSLIASVRTAVEAGRYHYGSEADLQHGLDLAFEKARLPWTPEVVCAGGRIDYLVGHVGVEVKVKGSADALRRQITRYAADPQFEAFLVVTTRRTHRQVQGIIGGKPVEVLVIGGLG